MSLPRTPDVVAVRRVFVGLLVVGFGPLAVGTVPVADATDGDAGRFGFENGTYRVDPPETAEIELDASGGGFVRVILDSPGDHFTVELVIGVSQNRGENPVLLLDTGRVDASDPGEYLSVTNGTIHRIRVHENDIDGGDLPGGRYDIRAIHDGNRVSATLDVAPSIRFGFDSRLNRSDIERNPVRAITGETDLQPGERVQIRVTSTGQNAFRLENETVVGADGRFETAVDLSTVPAGASFDIVARHDGLTRARQPIRLFRDLPEPTDGRQTSNGITFAYEGDQLTLEPAPNQTLSGETRLEEGTVITIILRSPESHLHVTTTEVDSYGAFEVTVNLEHLDPRDDLVVSALSDGEASGAAPVVVDTGSLDAAETGTDLQLGGDGRSADADTDRSLAVGLVAITVGVLLAIVAGGLLLGIGRS